jgi:hypothetical protein
MVPTDMDMDNNNYNLNSNNQDNSVSKVVINRIRNHDSTTCNDSLQTSSVAHPGSCPIGNSGSFPGVNATEFHCQGCFLGDRGGGKMNKKYSMANTYYGLLIQYIYKARLCPYYVLIKMQHIQMEWDNI